MQKQEEIEKETKRFLESEDVYKKIQRRGSQRRRYVEKVKEIEKRFFVKEDMQRRRNR